MAAAFFCFEFFAAFPPFNKRVANCQGLRMDFNTAAKGSSPPRLKTICERCAPTPNNRSAGETLQGAPCGREKQKTAGGRGQQKRKKPNRAQPNSKARKTTRTLKSKTEAKACFQPRGAAEKTGTPPTPPPNKKEGIYSPAPRQPPLKPARSALWAKWRLLILCEKLLIA